MLESLKKRGRPPKSPRSIERRQYIDQMPEYIKSKINARKVSLALAIKNIEPCASQSAYKKKVNEVRKQASRTAFTDVIKSMDRWWANFSRLGLTQDYVDGLEYMERGINLSPEQMRRFFEAQKLLDQKQNENSIKGSKAISSRWSGDKVHNFAKQTAKELMCELHKTKEGRSLGVRSCARWLASNWPDSNKPSFSSLQRYAVKNKCTNTDK